MLSGYLAGDVSAASTCGDWARGPLLCVHPRFLLLSASSVAKIRGMRRREFLGLVPGSVLAFRSCGLDGASAAWKAGVSAVDITPARSLWMAGFAARKEAAQGVALPLRAKALAVQSGSGRPAVLLTSDLLGVTRRITDRVAAAVQRRHGLQRADLLFNASHTHCGPVIDEQLSVAYDLSSEQWDAIRAYSAKLQGQLTTVIEEALSRLRPARLAYARGEAGFAANRRVSFTPDGPVDSSVPVLRVDAADGAPLAIAFGYACHNTTLQHTFVQYHGDYAGVAQAELERRYPGVQALFVAGCGADANPRPRGTVELVRQHGAALADAVERVFGDAGPLAPEIRTAYSTVDLPFVDADARDRWRRQLTIDPVYLKRYDALMERVVAREGRLPAAQQQPVQVWQLGPDLTMVALGGEVVVDYALRLAREYSDRRMWVAGYSNDVFGYVPSLRVRREGGYEGADAMIYYGRTGPFTEDVEELIVREVRRHISS
jgi:neutral ceramidase